MPTAYKIYAQPLMAKPIMARKVVPTESPDDSPYAVPAQEYNFLSGVLPPGLTYTNSSTTRTYFGADGLLKTAAANAPIFEYSPVTMALLGMRLEMEQRTNLMLWSSDISNASWLKLNAGAGTAPVVTANVAVAPDGTTTADRVDLVTTGASGDRSYLSQAYTKTNGVTYTSGLWLKAVAAGDIGKVIAIRHAAATTYSTITLTAAWARVPISQTADSTGASSLLIECRPVATGSSASASFYMWGAQLEAGTSLSSYIPTTTAAVIRQPDVLTASSISWYRPAEGTVVFEGIASALNGGGLFVFSDGTNNNRIGVSLATGTGIASSFALAGGVTQQSMATGNATSVGAIFRVAVAYKLDNYGIVMNGGTPVTDTAATVPAISQLRFGSSVPAGSSPTQLYIRRFQYFPTRLPNAQIQGMSRV